MDLGISGKVAMVAAASKGIGYATAKLLVEEGCKVSICGRTEQTVRSAADEIGASGFIADVSRAADLERWVERTTVELGAPEILVTNTGGPPAGPLDGVTDEQWLEGFDSTIMNIVRLSRLVTPAMIERNWGRIVHVTSLVAKEPNPLLPISSTLRAGLMGLVRMQTDAYAKHGITSNAVLPGHTLTDRQRHLAELRAQREGISMEEALDRQAKSIVSQRLGKPEEIAAAIVFLCSQQAAYINGVNLLVDGGAVKGLA